MSGRYPTRAFFTIAAARFDETILRRALLLSLCCVWLCCIGAACGPASVEAACEDVADSQCAVCARCVEACDNATGTCPTVQELCGVPDDNNMACEAQVSAVCSELASTQEDSKDKLQSCQDSLESLTCEVLFQSLAQGHRPSTPECSPVF